MTTPPSAPLDEPALPIPPSPGGGGNVTDAVDGLWDGKFARVLAITAIAFAAALILALVGLGVVFGRGGGEKHLLTEWVDGSFADRARFYLALVLMGVGGLLLVVAGFLAALEVRGRLKKPDTTTISSTGTGSPEGLEADPATEIVKVVVETIVKARATAIVAVAGIALMGLATVTAVSIEDGPPVVPAAKTGDTETGDTSTSTQEPRVGTEGDSTEPTATPASGDD